MKHKLLPKVTDNLFKWDDVIEILAHYCHNGLLNKALTDEPNPNKCDYFYTLALVDTQINIPHKVEHVYKTLNIEEEHKQRINNKYRPNVALYMSLAPYAFSHGIHRDATDVYHWQQLGTTKWVVYDNGKHTYELTPGDILFIPKGIYHDTLPSTPRAGLSLGWFPPDYNSDDGHDAVTSYLQQKGMDYDKPVDNSMQSQIFKL